MTWSLLPKICKQNTRQYHNWRAKRNSTFCMNRHIRCFFLDDQKQECLERDQRQKVDSNQVLMKPLDWIWDDTLVNDDQNRLCSKKFWWQRKRTLIFMRILSPHTWRLPGCPLLNPLHHQLIFYHWANIKWPFFSSENINISWSSIDILEPIGHGQLDIVVLKTHFLWTSNRVSCKGCYRTFGNQDRVVRTF